MPINVGSTPPPSKRSTPRKTAAPAISTVSDRVARRTDGVIALGSLAQAGLLMFGQLADAAAISMHLPNLAPEVARVAESADWLAKPLDLLIETGPYSALLLAALPFAMQIAANHGIIKAENAIGGNVVPKETLEAQMRARMLQQQADAMRAQRQAHEEAVRAQQEYEALVNDRSPVG